MSSCGPYAIDAAVAACVRSPDEHLAGLGVLLQARRDVDRIAADHQLPARRGFPAGDDLARVDADPEADLRAVPALDARPRTARSASRTASAARTARSGSSSCACGMPKTASTASPANFSVVPAEPLDLGVDQVEELALELADVLRIEQLAERSRAREVGEEHGDDAPLLPLVGSVRGAASVLAQRDAAGGAEGRGRRLLGPAAGQARVKRRAAVAAEAGVGGLLGVAGGAGESHAPSLRPLSVSPRRRRRFPSAQAQSFTMTLIASRSFIAR